MFHKSLSSQQTLEILMSSRDFDIYRSQNDLKIKTSRSSVSRFEKPDHFVRTAFRERKKHVAPSEAARDVSLLWLPSGLESCAISGSPSYPLSPASFTVTHGMPSGQLVRSKNPPLYLGFSWSREGERDNLRTWFLLRDGFRSYTYNP